jgi:hypothetical protein
MAAAFKINFNGDPDGSARATKCSWMPWLRKSPITKVEA